MGIRDTTYYNGAAARRPAHGTDAMHADGTTIARRYGLALVAVAVAAALTTPLYRIGSDAASPFLVFYGAVAVAAGIGGLWPGVCATIVSALVADLLFIAPRFRLEITPRGEVLHLALFVVVGVIISAGSENLRVRLRRAQALAEETERARRRLAFLDRAGIALDSSLDYTEVLNNLARLAVPYLADWCCIDIAGEGLAVQPFACAHADPAKEPLVRSLQCRYPLDPQGQHPVQKALRTGETVIYHDIPDSALVSAARDEDHLHALQQLAIRSYLCVPLRGRDRMLGAIFFASAARQRYHESDRALAEDLARRAASAVDNARLYRAAQDEIAERTRTEEELARNQEHIEALNERLKRAMVETHHRVKNNLQIITAMMDMRLMDGEQTVPVEEIRRLKAYIQALAAVHDILTQEAKGEQTRQDVSAKAVLEKLLPLMQQTAGGRHIAFELEDARLPAKQGASLALVVNELVSNAIKYGRGEIEVDMRVRETERAVVQSRDGHAPVATDSSGSPQTWGTGGTDAANPDGGAPEPEADRVALLRVRDDGPGFPAGFDPARAANTGLDLIENLSRWDLGGEALFENRPEGGAQVTIRIPLSQGVGGRV